MQIRSYFLLAMLAFLAAASACVPARKFEDTRAQRDLYKDSTALVKRNYDLSLQEIDKLQREIAALDDQNAALERDTTELGRQYRRVEAMRERLNEMYEKVIEQNRSLLEGSNVERDRYLAEVHELERDLREKEAQLKEKENDLRVKEQNLNEQQKDIAEKTKRIDELTALINRKDSSIRALRTNVAQALRGFQSDELTVEERDGRVYVSMTNKLLFKSGSTAVDPRGKEALGSLAGELKRNADIQIMVEGHTDNVPLSGGSAMKDNWDLSVLRATSIVRILLESGMKPEQVVPSGRGEYFPKASNATPEGRAQNRRTEIILTPKLEDILDLLQD